MNPAETYLAPLFQSLSNAANADIAHEQTAYMRGKFGFYGIKSPERKAIAREFINAHGLPKPSEFANVVKIMWDSPRRECQSIAQEMAQKMRKTPLQKDLGLWEYMVVHKSWWDTVDFIAVNLMGTYFKAFPDEINPAVDRWLDSGNIWLQRSALLFQLKYKKGMNTDLLAEVIRSLNGTDEFFINKAIGWVLREYGKTDPDWVVGFCSNTTLSGLSRREALRIIEK